MSRGLEPGTTLRDFVLPDEQGRPHRLSTLQGDNCMVLMLGRGEHCPRERQHQREMVRFHQWAPVAFTELVTVLPNDLHDVFKMKIAAGAQTVPHTVILSPGLRIEKVYVGYWFWGRPSIYQLWTDLQEIHARIRADLDPTTPEARTAWAAAQARAAA